MEIESQHSSNREKILAIRKYKKGGISQKEISDIFGISPRTFRRWLRQYNETNTLDRKSRSYESYKIKQKHVNYAIKILRKIKLSVFKDSPRNIL